MKILSRLGSSAICIGTMFAYGIWLPFACGQLSTGWKAHDWDRERPAVVAPGPTNLPLSAPSDAVILFNGRNLDEWRSADGGPAKWIVKEDVMESVPGSGYIFSAKSFGDVQLHVEWAAPEKVQGKSQGRGNSGVFLQGLFEVQVLDSFDNKTYADGQAGAVYGQYPPLVNASRKPGEWQSYDIFSGVLSIKMANLLSPRASQYFTIVYSCRTTYEPWDQLHGFNTNRTKPAKKSYRSLFKITAIRSDIEMSGSASFRRRISLNRKNLTTQ